MDIGLGGKRALVTGASGGIGLAIMKALSEMGCEVCGCARTKPLSGWYGNFIALDLSNQAGVDDLCQLVEEQHDSIDILINNIGGGGRWGDEKIANTQPKVWKEVYWKNAEVATLLTMWAIKGMEQRKWGRVVTIASVHGLDNRGRPWFNMAKSAEISLMKTLAYTQYYEGITFNSVCPGPIQVGNPLESGLMGQPEDVASLVAFLCSDQARWINGAAIVVDGGASGSF